MSELVFEVTQEANGGYCAEWPLLFANDGTIAVCIK